jgi:NADH:ubiquinone oxidoreductase subunit 2 (subunit N)
VADAWIAAAVALPAVAALAIGSRLLGGERWSEEAISGGAIGALGLGTVAALAGLVSSLLHGAHDVRYGTWLRSGDYVVDLALRVDAPGTAFAAFALGLTALTTWFSTAYMHREAGFARLYALLSLFGAAMALLGLAGNAVLAFVGWELGGACSALLIAFWPERTTASEGGVRTLVTNRPGDAAYVVAIGALAAGAGGVAFDGLADRLAAGPWWVPVVVASCVLVSAAGKAGMVPFTPWVGRAVEGPTPTSALFYGSVMLDAGVFLAVRYTPAFALVPGVRIAALVLGLATAVYGWLVARAQPDAKNQIVHRSVGSAGLAFALVGAGLPGVALAVALVLGTVRSLQMFLAPSVLAVRRVEPVRPVPAWLASRRGLQLAAADRFWLEEAHDALVAAPVVGVAGLAARFERGALEAATGATGPAVDALGLVLGAEEGLLEWTSAEVASPTSVFGRVTGAAAAGADRVEDTVVVHWLGESLPAATRAVGRRLAALEPWLQKPSLLLGGVALTLILVLVGGPR